MNEDLLIENRTPLQDYIIGNVAENAKKTTFGFDLGLKLAQEYGLNDIDQRESAMQATLGQFEQALGDMQQQKQATQAIPDEYLQLLNQPMQSKYLQALQNAPQPIPMPERKTVKKDRAVEAMLALTSLFAPQAANAYASYLRGLNEGVEDVYKQDMEKWQIDTQNQNIAFQRLLETAKSEDEWNRYMNEFRLRLLELVKANKRQEAIDKLAMENQPFQRMETVASALAKIQDPALAVQLLTSVGVPPEIAQTVAQRIDDMNKGKNRKADAGVWNIAYDNVKSAIDKTINAYGFVDDENRAALEELIRSTAETYGIDPKIMPKIPTGETLKKQYQDEARKNYAHRLKILEDNSRKRIEIALAYLGMARDRLKLDQDKLSPKESEQIEKDRRIYMGQLQKERDKVEAKYKGAKAVVESSIPEPEKVKSRKEMEFYKGQLEAIDAIINREKGLDKKLEMELKQPVEYNPQSNIAGAVKEFVNGFGPLTLNPNMLSGPIQQQKPAPTPSSKPEQKAKSGSKSGMRHESKNGKWFENNKPKKGKKIADNSRFSISE